MSPIRKFILMLALTLMWSPSFLFIKFALQEFQPLTIAALRVSIASCFLLLILRMRKRELPRDTKFWFHMAVMALIASVTPFYLFALAEQSIESALAAIVNGTSPMFTALFTLFLMPSDRLTPQKLLGIGLSAGGLVLLFAPNIVSGLSGSFSGILAATGASVSYALSHIYGKKYIRQQRAFVAPTAQLLMAALFLIPLALLVDAPFARETMPCWSAVGGVLGLACFGTTLAFTIYYKLLEHSGPTAISTVACFFPVGGMLLGFLFLNESFTIGNLFASLMILTGLVTVNGVIPLSRLQKTPAV